MTVKLGLFVIVALPVALHAQEKFAGTWTGSLITLDTLRMVLHVSLSLDGNYKASIDCPAQNMFGLNCDKVEARNNGKDTLLIFSIDKLKVSYTGKIINDTTLAGDFTQGATIPLVFYKTFSPQVVKAIRRPQTPKPPFPYRSEEVVYRSPDQLMQFGGTITIPQGRGPFPAVLLITGSGQQDRDETIFDHKPFAVIADALTKDGFVVLRVDDRGNGNTNGNFVNSTTADFANDANVSIDYLKTRPEVNDKKVGLLGHSEGGLIATIIASQRKDVAFIVLLAAPGVPMIDMMAEQNVAILTASGISPATSAQYKILYTEVANATLNAPDQNVAKQEVIIRVNNWIAKNDSSTVQAVGFRSEEAKQQYASQFVTQVWSPWMKYFMRINPHPYLVNLKKVKVLALNGSKDLQVVSRQNLPAISDALKEGHTKVFETKELIGLNHLFQTCTKCTLAEYGQLEETIAPVALQTITDCLNKNAK